jgi:hypothetical protein
MSAAKMVTRKLKLSFTMTYIWTGEAPSSDGCYINSFFESFNWTGDPPSSNVGHLSYILATLQLLCVIGRSRMFSVAFVGGIIGCSWLLFS